MRTKVSFRRKSCHLSRQTDGRTLVHGAQVASLPESVPRTFLGMSTEQHWILPLEKIAGQLGAQPFFTWGREGGSDWKQQSNSSFNYRPGSGAGHGWAALNGIGITLARYACRDTRVPIRVSRHFRLRTDTFRTCVCHQTSVGCF